MMQWYQNNMRLFLEERGALAAACPLMMLSIVGPGFRLNQCVATNIECAVAHGTYAISAPEARNDIEYGISLMIPANYPKSPPVMFCNDPKLPINMIDRHILQDGQACLEVRPEINRRWPPGSNLVNFLNHLVHPFLAWQLYYDVFGKPPEWGERTHNQDGIIQYYTDLLGIDNKSIISGFMKLLARKNHPKGHEICPCGSEKKLRHCHMDLLRKTRKILLPQWVAQDIKLIKNHRSHSALT